MTVFVLPWKIVLLLLSALQARHSNRKTGVRVKVIDAVEKPKGL